MNQRLTVLASIAALTGCQQMYLDFPSQTHLVDEKVETRSRGVWRYDAQWTQETTPRGGVWLRGKIGRFKECDIITTRTEEKVTTHVRTAPSPRANWVYGVMGAAGAGLLGWGLNEVKNNDEPMVRRTPEGNEPTGAAVAVYIGGAASLLLIPAIVNAVRSIDTTSSEDVATRRKDVKICERAPAAKAKVALFDGARRVADAVTNDVGFVEIRVPLADIDKVREAIAIRVDESELKERISKLQGLAPPPFPLQRIGAQTLLARTSVKGADKTSLQTAVAREGAEVIDLGNFKDEFDLAGAHWLNANKLTLYYGTDAQFFAARFDGDFRGQDHVQLLRLFNLQWGEATFRQEDEKVPRYIWDLGDGIQAVYHVKGGTGLGLAHEAGSRLVIKDLEAKARFEREMKERRDREQ